MGERWVSDREVVGTRMSGGEDMEGRDPGERNVRRCIIGSENADSERG